MGVTRAVCHLGVRSGRLADDLAAELGDPVPGSGVGRVLRMRRMWSTSRPIWRQISNVRALTACAAGAAVVPRGVPRLSPSHQVVRARAQR